MDKKEFPEPLEALMLVLLTFGVIFFLTLSIAVISALINLNNSVINSDLILINLSGVLFLLVPIYYVKVRKYNRQSLFRLNQINKDTIILSIIIGVAMAIVGDELDRLIQIIIPTPEWFLKVLQSLKAETFSEWFLLITGGVFIAAISEELLFRGFLQVSLEKKGDVTKAVLLSSLCWTFIHMNPFWAIQIFIMGVIIGFIAWRTNSIIPCMIIHATNNFLSLLTLNFNLEEEMEWYSMGDHVSPLVILPALILIIWSIRRITDMYKFKTVEPG